MTKNRRWLQVAMRAAEFESIKAQHERGLAEREHKLAAGEAQLARSESQSWVSAWQEQRRSASFAADLAYQYVTAHAEHVHGEKQKLADAREADLTEATSRLNHSHSRKRALEEFERSAASQEARLELAKQLAVETEAWMLGHLNKGATTC